MPQQVNEQGLRVEWAFIVPERLYREGFHVVSANLPTGTGDVAVRDGLGELDRGGDPAMICSVDRAKLLGESLGLCHVAPPGASGFGNPNAACVRPYGGQYLYLGPVGVADGHCQIARGYGAEDRERDLTSDNIPHVRYHFCRRSVPERRLVHYQKSVDVAQAGHVRASPDGAAEDGLHHVVACLSEGIAQTLEVSRDSLLVDAGVRCEKFLAPPIEAVVRHDSRFHLQKRRRTSQRSNRLELQCREI